MFYFDDSKKRNSGSFSQYDTTSPTRSQPIHTSEMKGNQQPIGLFSPPRFEGKSRFALGTPVSFSPWNNLSFNQSPTNSSSLSTSQFKVPPSKENKNIGSNFPTPRTNIKNLTNFGPSPRTTIKALTNTPTPISEKIQEAKRGLDECKRLLEKREEQDRGWDNKISTLIEDFNKQIKFKENLQERLYEILQSTEQGTKEIEQLENNIIETNSDLSSVDTKIHELDHQIHQLQSRLQKSEEPNIWRKNFLLVLIFFVCVLLATWISLFFSGFSFTKSGLKIYSLVVDTSEHFKPPS